MTPTQIHANFAVVMRTNLSSTKGAQAFSKLSAFEMQDMMYAYARTTGGNTTDLVAIARVYAPASVPKVQQAATLALAGWTGTNTLARSRLMLRGAPSTGTGNTLQEIYLDFRTAPGGLALGPTAAAWETAVYAMQNLGVAYGAGYTAGTGVRWLLQTYTPDLYNDIGGTIDSALINLGNALSDVQAGYWERVLGDLFDINILTLSAGNGSDLYGDFGVMDDYFATGSKCPPDPLTGNQFCP